MWKQWVNSLIGAAVIAIAFLGSMGPASTWTLLVLGMTIVVLSAWTVGEVPREEYERVVHKTIHSHA